MGTGAGRTSVTPRSRLLLPLLTAVIALAVVIGSAVSAPWHADPGGTAIDQPAPQITLPEQPAAEPAEPPEESTDSGVPLMLWAVIAGLVLLILALRAFLARASFTRGTDGGVVETTTGGVLPVADVPLEPDLPALRRGVAAARAALAGHAEPDDAVIAAWLELEAAAASSGVDRAPSDTPTELTTAVLGATRADAGATRTLLHLYHRARFAPHAVLDAADVARAVGCLERIAESWQDT
ncbi:DUF4129 domain-containing protein [Georgenia sp. MJ173]|uniref:DUF4129 domain-containing protein n=1 Tax=Georgenia sunbinii TaxID=3117728 RepID=UPI002F26AAC1